jgi:Fe-S cluster assembly protein SufD
MIQLHSLETLKEQLRVQDFPLAFLDSPQFSDGLSSLTKSGLPTPRNEEWKYFPLNSLLMADYTLPIVSSHQHDPKQFQPFVKEALHLVIINGNYVNSDTFEQVEGITCSIEHSPVSNIDNNPKENPFPILNALLHKDRIVLHIEKEYDFSIPIHILQIFQSDSEIPLLASPSVTIKLAKNAKAKIIESYHILNVKNGLINTSFSVHADQESEFHHIIIQDGMKDCALIYNCESIVKSNAKVQDHVIVHDSNKVRNTIAGKLVEEHALYNIYGIVSADKQSLIDNHTVVDHIAPHCESNELFKHVLDESSTAVFNGKIFVRLDAQKTNAYQSNRTLLLSPKATINTKPQLEIFADDVKCSHGATTGSVDEEALYYLQARGIPREIGMRLLTEAFIGEVIQLIDIEELQSYFTGSLLLSAGE